MSETAEVVNVTNKSKQIMEKGEKNNLWPQDLNSRDKKKIAYISAQYGLDPFFSDLTVLGGNPYVTASGLKRNAHESEDPPAAIQVELNNHNENKRWWEYKAKLWKESSPQDRPYIEYGEASPQDCNSQISKSNKDLKAMARTRAINRVIRLAYNISLTSAEELSGYDPESQEIKDVTDEGYDNNATPKNKTQTEMTLEEAKQVIIPGGKKYDDKPTGEAKDWRLKWVKDNWNKDPKVKKAAEIVYNHLQNQDDSKQEGNNGGRKMSEREVEIYEYVKLNPDLLKDELNKYLRECDVKRIDDLSDQQYEDLVVLFERMTSGKTDEEFAEEVAAGMDEEEEDFDPDKYE